jgi:ABC-type multidrug transport system fused ATPase/permease subunit
MVLNKGEIVEFDSPQVLLEKHDSVFYSMTISARNKANNAR